MKYIIMLLISILLAFNASAETDTIVIKDGSLSTTEIIASANKKIEFKIKNLDENFEEFKSKALSVEIEDMPINSEIIVSLPPLKPGIYPFKVEFKSKLLGIPDDRKIHGNIIVK